MRLLELRGNGTFSLTKDLIHNIPHYAILSHTWGDDDEEVTLKDMMDGSGKTKVGYRKIQFCAERASSNGLQYIWVDTCCIDKSNNAELSEAIISMFCWYRNSTKCYVYLADVSTDDRDPTDQSFQSWQPAFRKSRWFSRGWTLQELIAPQSVEVFSVEGNLLGDKKSLKQTIQEITGRAVQALEGSVLSGFSVSERLSWAEFRETRREEDKAYSLLGMFNAYMPPLYGERIESAFRRLREEINKGSNSAQAIKYADFGRIDAFSSLLHSLMFDNMLARETQFDKANAITLDWIWALPIGPSNLTQWLSIGTGVFWTQGKPGSGKSTLMSYLKEYAETKQWLAQASNGSWVTIRFYYYFRAREGTPNSFEGLLRAFLYQLALKVPELSPVITKFGSESIPQSGIQEELTWTISKLREGLISPLKTCTTNVFMLIDGVDELEGGLEVCLI
jgi:hypothetical protein